MENENDFEEMDSTTFNNLKLNFAIKCSNIGVWDYDARVNRAFFSDESKQIIGITDENFGCSPDDWNNRVHPEDNKKYFKNFKDHLQGEKDVYENEYRILSVDGSYKWILDKGMIIKRAIDGSVIRVVGTHVDITQSKKEEEVLRQSLNLITRQNNKLNHFAHMAAHNLKEHIGNLQSLLNFYEEAETNEEKEKLITHLKTVSSSLFNTIENLKEIVSIDKNKNNKTEIVKLNEFVEYQLSILDVKISSTKAQITINIDANIYVNMNKAYLESIIQNLLSNALKYRHPDRRPIIKLSTKKLENKIILTVSDNGIGIDLEKHRKDLFGLYKTFHSNKNAEGVGLYITKSQIESYGGTIEVNSKLNNGTTFTITLPL